jgi:hypothetical protein
MSTEVFTISYLRGKEAKEGKGKREEKKRGKEKGGG